MGGVTLTASAALFDRAGNITGAGSITLEVTGYNKVAFTYVSVAGSATIKLERSADPANSWWTTVDSTTYEINSGGVQVVDVIDPVGLFRSNITAQASSEIDVLATGGRLL